MNYYFPLQLIRCLGVAVLVVTGASAQAQSIEDLRKRLEAPLSAKDWPAAEAIARQIVSQSQSSSADWRNLASVLRSQNKTTDAHAARLELIKKPGANSGDYTGVCWYLLEQNKPLEARPACQKAVDLKSDSYAALVNLGHTYLLVGDKTQAMPWYQKTLSNIKKEEELTQGPLDDFNLFIKNGWVVADAQASKAWFSQGWIKIKSLRDVRDQNDLEKIKNQCADKIPVLAKAVDESSGLLGAQASFTDVFVYYYLSCSNEVAMGLLAKRQDEQALQTIESAWSKLSGKFGERYLWTYFEVLADEQVGQGYRAAANGIYERILREKMKSLGEDHPDTLTSMSNLAFTYGQLGQHDQALALNEKALAGRTAKLGADHPDTLTSMSNLAFTYGQLGQHDKALALNEKALAGRTAKLGADHPDTLTSMGNLASTYGELGQHDKALALNEKALAGRTTKLGVDHPDTLTSISNLAFTYGQLGQHDQALALNEKALAGRTAKLGADHPDTLTSMSNLASTYGKLGQHDKALALKEKALAGRTAKLGADHPDTLTSMNNLAFTYGELGQYDKALVLGEKALAGFTAKLGADHPGTLDSMIGLSMSLYKLKRYTQATNVLQTLLTKLVKQDGEAKDTTQFLMSMLVISLEAQGQSASFLQAYKPETQAAVKRLVPATKMVLSK